MTNIKLILDKKTYIAYPCKKCKMGYERLEYISKEEIIKSKILEFEYSDESGFLEEDVVVFNENNLGFVIREKEIEKSYKTYLSAKGINRIKRLLKDILLNEISNMKLAEKGN